MHRTIETAFSQERAQGLAVGEIPEHEAATDYGISMPGGEVVVSRHIMAAADEQLNHMRANVTCSADDEKIHMGLI